MKIKRFVAFILSFCIMQTVVPTTWAADNSCTINGVTITPTSVVSSSSDLKNCSTYATAVLKAIGKWTSGMTTYSSSHNILAGKSAENRKITADHVREFIQAAPVGSRIRICSSSDTTSNNNDCIPDGETGHTMVLVEKNDSSGEFTIFEAVDSDSGYYARSKTYTYQSFAKNMTEGKYNKYNYFFYVSYYSGSNLALVSSTTSGNWQITIPTNYKLVCYDSANATRSSVHYISAKTSPYTLSCTQKATLSNGKTRYFFVSGDNKSLWFDYTSGMSVGSGGVSPAEPTTPAATPYAVVFDPNDGIVSPTFKTVTNGSAYGTLPTPTRNGYIFDGWYTSATGGSLVTSNVTVHLTGHQTLYAHWIKEASSSYTVTFDPNGGSVFPTSKILTSGTLLTGMPTPKRSGYTFVGWAMNKIDPDSSVAQTTTIVADGVFTFDKDTTLYALWKRDCINHAYDADICVNCGARLPYDNGFNSSAAGIYQVSSNAAYIRTGPYQVKNLVRTASQGEFMQVVGSVINSYNNIWMKTTDGYYVHAEKLTRVNGTQPSINEPEIFQQLPNGVYTLAPLCALGSRLDVAGADWRDNANVQIHESNGTLAQRWEITYLGDGYYQLICKASGKALDVSQSGTEPGTNVQQFEPNGTYAQQWKIDTAADGSYFIIPRVNPDLHLDVSGAGNANGTNVQIYTANGSEAQLWDITLVTSVISSSKPDSDPSTSTPQYFNCNVGIFCVNGKTVNLYNNPGDSTRVDYFSLGQSVGSSYGVNMPDGSTWYRVSVTSKGNVITVWLKYESDKMTVRNLG